MAVVAAMPALTTLAALAPLTFTFAFAADCIEELNFRHDRR
jgi:hypothetical protein